MAIMDTKGIKSPGSFIAMGIVFMIVGTIAAFNAIVDASYTTRNGIPIVVIAVVLLGSGLFTVILGTKARRDRR
jgi:hypothetical protein